MHSTWARIIQTILATLSFAAYPAAGGDEAPRELVRKVLDALPKDPYVARLKVTVPNGPTRTLEVRQKILDGSRVTYLEVVAPDELSGVRFLFRQPGDRPNEQFVKIPASRVLVQVSEDLRTQPFLGSTFYVTDLVEPPIDRFDYAFVGEEELLGRPCKLVEARPKEPKDQVYGKTILALDPNDLLIVRRQFFGPDGRLLKVWTVDRVEKVDGRWTMLEQKMENVQEKVASELDVESITYGAELDDQMFTPKYLLR
ncbi:MAG TPA: outer membrane lipoprotein-sorting protein [Candidatus Dormibacteraeota bacterium]|nr:outer membrane lipoprotein-sorting protein [Candidatus Dormibacteraeota bacterium]